MKKRTCSFDGCGRSHYGCGYCRGHLAQLRRGAELAPLLRSKRGTCIVDECGGETLAHGYCSLHLQRWLRHGDALRVDRGREGSRKYPLNESFFDEITTETQAYWLGFITADGGIIRSGRTFALRVELSARDEAHLIRMCDDLDASRPFRRRTGLVAVSFDSWRLVASLERLGVTPRKSLSVEPWDGPGNLMPHYWRGMVDGDGSIYRLTTRTEWGLDLSGSKGCVHTFAAWAKSVSGASATPRPRKGGIWSWAVTGTYKPQLMAEILYGNAAISLSRKQQLADELRLIDWAAWRRRAYRERSERRKSRLG